MDNETVNAILVEPGHSGDSQRTRDVVVGMLEVSAPHHRALLGVLANANLHGFDAAPLIAGLSDELPGASGRRILQLSQELEAGGNLVDALEKVPDVLPPSCLLAIRLAAERGTERGMFRELSNRLPDFDQNLLGDQNNFSKLAKVSAKAFFVFGIVVFLMLKIVPEFQKMMEEFGVDPSPPFVLLLTVSDYIAKLWFVIFFALLILFFLALPGLRRYLRRWNPLTWRQKHLTPAMDRRRSLALATQRNQPLTTGLDTILACKPFQKIFNRLGKVRSRIDGGQKEWEALAAEKMISSHEAKALAMSSDEETQAWLLRWSAKTRQDNHGSTEDFWVRIIVLLVNIGIAFFVFLTAVAVFSTLLKLMEVANQ